MRSADPAGVAELFTDLWLRSDRADEQSGTAQAAHALAPEVPLPQRSGKAAQQVLLRTTAVRSVRLSDGSWSVIVAAQYAPRTAAASPDPSDAVVRYFAVPVLSSDGAGGAGAFTVRAAPAEVSGPAVAPIPEAPTDRILPGNGLVATPLREFFAAYLTGVGEVDRYLSPGTTLAPVRGSGYTAVTVDQVSADTEAADGPVPEDGRRARVRAQVTATDASGDRWPLAYDLSLTARDGRWEVTALDAGAPTLAGQDSPTPTTTTTGGESR
ncbi:Conjugative transposon protein TcpC [Actinacidiphila glaucinigra]|uniref:Conjugative transposon protein TcpC n=1 Tax=Actinacidiphila glaucinigra TaxID=235986 RepID=A0A239LR20_9ACTN|nr:Conjugative transposon protein TcpC [Actinacidiphila glaucinigra]